MSCSAYGRRQNKTKEAADWGGLNRRARESFVRRGFLRDRRVTAQFARQPAEGIRPERIARDHFAFGMMAFHALKRAALETLGTWGNVRRHHSHLALRTARPTYWQKFRVWFLCCSHDRTFKSGFRTADFSAVLKIVSSVPDK